MEKVKVTKEVFNSLEACKRDGGLLTNLEYVAKEFAEKSWTHPDYVDLNKINFKTYLDCAYYGYEVETTLGDYIAVLLSVHSGLDVYDRGFRDGLTLISEKLGINLDSLK